MDCWAHCALTREGCNIMTTLSSIIVGINSNWCVHNPESTLDRLIGTALNSLINPASVTLRIFLQSRADEYKEDAQKKIILHETRGWFKVPSMLLLLRCFHYVNI